MQSSFAPPPLRPCPTTPLPLSDLFPKPICLGSCVPAHTYRGWPRELLPPLSPIRVRYLGSFSIRVWLQAPDLEPFSALQSSLGVSNPMVRWNKESACRGGKNWFGLIQSMCPSRAGHEQPGGKTNEDRDVETLQKSRENSRKFVLKQRRKHFRHLSSNLEARMHTLISFTNKLSFTTCEIFTVITYQQVRFLRDIFVAVYE